MDEETEVQRTREILAWINDREERWQEMATPLFTEEQRRASPVTPLIEKLLQYSQISSLGNDMKQAQREFTRHVRKMEFFDEEQEHQPEILLLAFNDWYMFRWKNYDGLTIPERLSRNTGISLEPDEVKMLDAIINSRFSVYEVVDVSKPGELTVLDIFRGGMLTLKLGGEEEQFCRWDLLGVRTWLMGEDHTILSVMFVAPPEEGAALHTYGMRKARQAVGTGEYSGIDEFLENRGLLLAAYWYRRCEKDGQSGSLILTPEGDLMRRCEALHIMKDETAVLRLLERNSLMLRIDPGALSGDLCEDLFFSMLCLNEGEIGFEWRMNPEMEARLRSGEHPGPPMPEIPGSGSSLEFEFVFDWELPPRSRQDASWFDIPSIDPDKPGRVFGSLLLSAGTLSFYTWSTERLENGKEELKRLLGEGISHFQDTVDDQSALIELVNSMEEECSNEFQELKNLPEEAMKARLDSFSSGLWDWVDSPSDMLDGRTPREAAGTRTGRRKVNRMLKMLEHEAESSCELGEVAGYFSSVRSQLAVKWNQEEPGS